MYDEDRQTVMAMYERMFDETADEQGLLQLLVSPTRQAVVLARSYDAKERKLQIESRSQDENYMPDPEDVPSFIFVIDKTAQQAAELGTKDIPVSDDQISIFDEAAPIFELEPDEESAAEAEASDVTDCVPAGEAPAEEMEASPAEAEVPLDAELSEEEESSNVEETADALDAFLADFSIEDGELVAKKAEAEVSVEEYVSTQAAEEQAEEISSDEATDTVAVAVAEPKIKTNIFLLILYIFVAIPVGLAGIALLLIPTLLCLSLAAVFVYIGISTIGMCLSSFAVIADTMVVFGAGLILVALSLLFVWLFIWFLGGLIVGFIRCICRLGRKLCCKEVAVQ